MISAKSRKASFVDSRNFSRFDSFLVSGGGKPYFSVFIFSDIGKNHQLRKKYTIQLGENELVLKVYVHVSLFNLSFVATSTEKRSLFRLLIGFNLFMCLSCIYRS